MIKQYDLPAWRDPSVHTNPDNVFKAISVVFARDGQYYFDGLIGSLLGLKQIPHAIELSLDAETMACIARLSFGEGGDDEAFFSPFEIESFALLWNENPDEIHGMDGERITLSLNPGDLKYPVTTSHGEVGDLYLKDEMFVIAPNMDFVEDMDEAA